MTRQSTTPRSSRKSDMHRFASFGIGDVEPVDRLIGTRYEPIEAHRDVCIITSATVASRSSSRTSAAASTSLSVDMESRPRWPRRRIDGAIAAWWRDGRLNPLDSNRRSRIQFEIYHSIIPIYLLTKFPISRHDSFFKAVRYVDSLIIGDTNNSTQNNATP